MIKTYKFWNLLLGLVGLFGLILSFTAEASRARTAVIPVHGDEPLPAKFSEWVFESKQVVKGAPRIKLVLNEFYFIAYMLTKLPLDKVKEPHIKNFLMLAEKTDENAFKDFQAYRNALSTYVFEDAILKSYGPYFEKLKKSEDYKILLAETKAYIKSSREEWDKNLSSSSEYMTKYSGFNFGENVDVYITHPYLGNGRGWKNGQNKICFGALPTFDNYFTVYIWHEILHLHMEYDNVSHSVNQLLTDNDLRMYLNKEATVGKFEGHPELLELMKLIEPEWVQYKKSPTNLNSFVKKLLAKDSIKKMESSIQKMESSIQKIK